MDEMREQVSKKRILRILASSDTKLKQAINFVNYLVKKGAAASPPSSVAPAGEKVSS